MMAIKRPGTKYIVATDADMDILLQLSADKKRIVAKSRKTGKTTMVLGNGRVILRPVD